MLPVILVMVLFVKTALTGTPCPPRENIYPCSCLNIKPRGPTAVQCHRLPDKESLEPVFRSLKSMQLDHFHLYDSFWYDEKSVNNGKNAKALPHDWLESLKSKSIEIVDTSLSSCFACDVKFPCMNIATTRFVAINSTSSSNLCTLCPTGRNNSYPWINCMSNLQELSIIRGKLENLGADFFPIRLEKLRKLNLSHNEIRIISPKAFQGLDTLVTMDLSHNRIISLANLFPNTMKLLYLDVSWNKIESLDDKFFRKLPKLKSFFARSNHFIHLIEEHWKNLPQSLSYVDIEDNPLKCNCNMKWVTTTFDKKRYLKGYCSNGKQYQTNNLKLRIQYLLKWCELVNKTSTLKPKQTGPPKLVINGESTVTFEQITKNNNDVFYID